MPWIMIWLLMFTLTIFACTQSTREYFQYNVKVDMVYKKESELPFPAITFCNVNFLKRSVAGSSANIILFGKLFSTFSKSVGTILNEMKKESKYCATNKTSGFASMEMAEVLNKAGVTIFSEVGEGYEDLVEKCWWNNREEKCDNLFTNHFTDLAWCFTYNPAYNLFLEGRDWENVTQKEEYSQKIAKSYGPKSGAKFLLNTKQDEYCGNMRDYQGAGFNIMVHDSLLLNPLFLLQPSASTLRLMPGTELTIILKPIKFNRKTEHLGKCRNPQYDAWISQVWVSNQLYDKPLCTLLCHVTYAHKTCGCFPNWIQGNEAFIGRTLNLTEKTILQHLCNSMTSLLCLRNTANEMFYIMQSECHHCIDPCFESKYEQTVSTLYFPSKSAGTIIAAEFGINFTQFRKNYMTLNVFIEDMNVLNIFELQEFTFINLMIYYGGIIGLFLGMSFLSVFEPIYQILRHIKLFLKFFRKPKTRVIKISIKQPS